MFHTLSKTRDTKIQKKILIGGGHYPKKHATHSLIKSTHNYTHLYTTSEPWAGRHRAQYQWSVILFREKTRGGTASHKPPCVTLFAEWNLHKQWRWLVLPLNSSCAWAHSLGIPWHDSHQQHYDDQKFIPTDQGFQTQEREKEKSLHVEKKA